MTMNYLAEKRYFESSRVTVEIEDVATIDPLSGSKLLIEAIYGPDVFMIIFLISFLGAFFLTRDYDVGTMKNVVSMGHERWKIYLMKNIVLMIGTLFFVVSFIIAPVLFGSLYYGFGDLIDQEMFINLTKTIAISLMYYMAIAAIIALLSLISNNPGVTTALTLGIFFVWNTGLSYLSGKHELFENIGRFSILHQFPTIGERVFNKESLLFLIELPIGTTIIVIIFGMLLFQRREIK